MDQSFFPISSISVVFALDFYCSEQMVDLGQLEPMEAVDTAVEPGTDIDIEVEP